LIFGPKFTAGLHSLIWARQVLAIAKERKMQVKRFICPSCFWAVEIYPGVSDCQVFFAAKQKVPVRGLFAG
jgi:hypothetical protein